MTAYLPPMQTTPLNTDLLNKIDFLKSHYTSVICTNAFSLTWDKNGEETYGIFELLNIFSTIKHQALIISDPSGTYQKHLQNKNAIPENVIIIAYNHDFFEVLKLADAFIRNTTTDGDSISIHEAISLKKTVFATDIGNRPQGCTLYNNHDNKYLQNLLSEYSPIKNEIEPIISCYPKLSYLYLQYLK